MENEVRAGSRLATSLEQQKRLLIAQGAMYRLGLSESRQHIGENLRVDVLARTAVSHLFAGRQAALGNIFSMRNLKRVDIGKLRLALPFLLPVLTKVATRFSNRGFGRGRLPGLGRGALSSSALVGSASLVGAVSLGILVYRWRRIKSQKAKAGFRTARKLW